MQFLGDAGVIDGLVPVAGKLNHGPFQGNYCGHYFSTSGDPALDSTWLKYNDFGHVTHPLTIYTIKGEAWHLPGQNVVQSLSSEARKHFAILLLQHLLQFGTYYLSFHVGRFERNEQYRDVQSVRTPLNTFIMTRAWLPTIRKEEESFATPSNAWLMTDRRGDPKFVERVTDEAAELLEADGEAYNILSEITIWTEDMEESIHRCQTSRFTRRGL